MPIASNGHTEAINDIRKVVCLREGTVKDREGNVSSAIHACINCIPYEDFLLEIHRSVSLMLPEQVHMYNHKLLTCFEDPV